MVSEVLLHVNCVPKVEDNTRHVLKIYYYQMHYILNWALIMLLYNAINLKVLKDFS